MTIFEWMEFSSYLVTVIALPFAIAIFIYEQRKERQNEEGEIHQRLADDYTSFLKLVLDNADLQLIRRGAQIQSLTAEQEERKWVLFGILVSLFERAYILVFEERMSKQTKRLWQSWEDYMREWCRRDDFRAALPDPLKAEDEEFSEHIRRIATEEGRAA